MDTEDLKTKVIAYLLHEEATEEEGKLKVREGAFEKVEAKYGVIPGVAKEWLWVFFSEASKYAAINLRNWMDRSPTPTKVIARILEEPEWKIEEVRRGGFPKFSPAIRFTLPALLNYGSSAWLLSREVDLDVSNKKHHRESELKCWE